MHVNLPKCDRCQEVFNKYPLFHAELEMWFWGLKNRHPEAHISWAGRGRTDQELFFSRGTSRAHWTQSSHNYNAAIDLFKLDSTGKADFGTEFYNMIVGPEVMREPWLCWYGAPGAVYAEKPHVEVREWRSLVERGLLRLVE